MNRSYSKIRHIQEANALLEKRRFLVEQNETGVDAQSMLSDEGLGNEDSKTFCSPSTPPPIVQKLLNKIPENIKGEAIQKIKEFANKIKNFSLKDLINLRREVKQAKKQAKNNKEMNEQVAPIVIAGISFSPLILVAIVVVLVIVVIALIMRGSSKGGGGCNPGWWDDL
jgi:hypothetical protein